MDNRDVGLPTTSLSSMPAVSLPYDTLGGDAGYSDLFAEGGSVQSYASGGIVSLALNKALKG
jgi:hypothetical protein